MQTNGYAFVVLDDAGDMIVVMDKYNKQNLGGPPFYVSVPRLEVAVSFRLLVFEPFPLYAFTGVGAILFLQSTTPV